jgi:hypothetical protein
LRRRRFRRYLALGFLLGLIYLLAFPVLSGREGYFQPAWARALPGGEPQAPSGGTGRVSWFKAGRWFGYVRADGGLLYTAETLHGVALSDSGFISFAKLAENFVFQDPAGRFLSGFHAFGYPVLDEGGGRLYSISTGLNGLSRLDRDGERLWSVEFFSPITSLALHADDCLVGLLDGTVKLIDVQGKIVQELVPQASRIPVILATAFSPDGRRLAVVSGIDPQLLTLLQRRGGSFAAEQVLQLGSDFRRGLALRFSADGRSLAFEAPDGLALLELGRREPGKIALPGRLLALDCASSGLLAVGSRHGGGSRLLLLQPPGSPLYVGEVAAGELFLRFDGASLLIGLPSILLRVDYLEG